MPDREFTPLLGEPSFPLLARDRHAPGAVEKWADERELEIRRGYGGNKKKFAEELAQLAEAREIAQKMRGWRIQNMGVWKGASPVIEKVEVVEGFTGGVQDYEVEDASSPSTPYMLTGEEESADIVRAMGDFQSS